MDRLNLEQKQRETARWRILRVLDAGRPMPVSEAIVWRVVTESETQLSPNAVRRELSYLRDLALLEIEHEDTETWSAKLTARGVDVVEYTIAAPAGIARPRKNW
jgi:RIO-like serine/threonine protein kinase